MLDSVLFRICPIKPLLSDSLDDCCHSCEVLFNIPHIKMYVMIPNEKNTSEPV